MLSVSYQGQPGQQQSTSSDSDFEARNDTAQSRRTTPAKPDGVVRLGDSETDNCCARERQSSHNGGRRPSGAGLRSLLFQRSLIPFQAREARQTLDYECEDEYIQALEDVFVNQLHAADGAQEDDDIKRCESSESFQNGTDDKAAPTSSPEALYYSDGAFSCSEFYSDSDSEAEDGIQEGPGSCSYKSFDSSSGPDSEYSDSGSGSDGSEHTRQQVSNGGESVPILFCHLSPGPSDLSIGL